MTNKNILEVCLSPDLGGLELYMMKCSNELRKEFNVINLIAYNSKLELYFKDAKDTFSIKRKSSFSLISAFKIAKLIEQYKIDIIHLHWTKDIPIVVIGKLLSKRKPKIIQSRHMNMTRFKNDFYHKFLYKNIDEIIAVTKQLEKQLIKFIPNGVRPEIKQIYLGAHCPSKYSHNEIALYKENLNCDNSFIIGFVGRINDSKGQYLLIDAMKQLIDKQLDIKAFFVGSAMEESYLEQLRQKIVDLNLESAIEFLGFTNEPHKFMQACDCMVVASKNETFGLVAIETMQMETAVIGANSGGILEIIDDEVTGLLFENRDANSLSTQIEKLYNDSSLKNRLAMNGFQKAMKCFNHELHMKDIILLFKGLE